MESTAGVAAPRRRLQFRSRSRAFLRGRAAFDHSTRRLEAGQRGRRVRAGNGVLIDNGLVLTIGYLITEAEAVWLHLGDGRVVEGHALGFDSVSGFGLVQALGELDLDPLPLGSSPGVCI